MNRNLVIALTILALVVLAGGWKSVRSSLAREATHTLYREIIKH